MEKFIICGGNKLYGKVNIQSAKNSVLPLISASIIANGKTRIKNCPKIKDVFVMCDILRAIGGKAEFDGEDLTIDTRNVNNWRLPSDLTGQIRSSLFLVGALIHRFGYVSIKMPGGCKIGARPIDIHIDALKSFGIGVKEDDEIIFTAKSLKNATVFLRFPSVGATENAVMVAVGRDGVSKIKNCAKEPEIVDLQNYLNAVGCKVSGAGTSEITVEGVKTIKCDEIEFLPTKDRIEVGTFILATACTGGEIQLDEEDIQISYPLMKIFEDNTCKITYISDKIYNIAFNQPLKGFGRVITGPYPDFPTDLQPQLTACACSANGLTAVVEKVFPERFSYAEELKILGADLSVHGNSCLIQGGCLHGGKVIAGDLRGGAALVIGALIAEGQTEVKGVGHIDRGYFKLEDKLSLLGAKIKRVSY